MQDPAHRSTLASLTLLSLFATIVVAAGDHAYVGSGKCKTCHLKEYRSWQTTKMASAFDLLKPGASAEARTEAGLDPDGDYTADVSCLPCHTTGYGQPGGFVDIESTPTLAGVGCESCHGPGGTYLQEGYMTLKNKEYEKSTLVAVGLVPEVTREQCVDCHHATNPFVGLDFVFDFEAAESEDTHETFPLKYAHGPRPTSVDPSPEH